MPGTDRPLSIVAGWCLHPRRTADQDLGLVV